MYYIYLFDDLHETQIKFGYYKPNYTLLKEIFKIMDSRETSEILASFGFKNLDKQVFTLNYIYQYVLWFRYPIHWEWGLNLLESYRISASF